MLNVEYVKKMAGFVVNKTQIIVEFFSSKESC